MGDGRASRLFAAALLLACSRPSRAQHPDSADVPPVHSRDSAVTAATAALQAGEAWRASQLLQPALADTARRTPEAVLLAAVAASRWDGWTQVDAFLAREPWLDSLFEGRGRALLARATLARARSDDRAANTAAAAHAAAAVASAHDRRDRGERLAVLARALDRLEMRDSARATYAQAADALPDVADWLLLRAAGVTADSAARAGYLAAVRGDAARQRAPYTDALARERTGDVAGALRAYQALAASAGPPGPVAARAGVWRMRLDLARSAWEQGNHEPYARLREELLAVVASRGASAEARTATEILDLEMAPLSANEELDVARGALAGGDASRAVQGFHRAFASRAGARLATPADRYAYGLALSRIDRDRDAAAQFARVVPPRATPALAAAAAYQRGRSLVGARRFSAARGVLRALVKRYPRDTSAGAALFLLGELASDDGRDADARTAYLDAAKRAPTLSRAPLARFRAALLAFVGGNARRAALEWDSLAARYPRSDETLAAIYWAGRAWKGAGDTARAAEHWRAVIAREPLSYYAAAGARRLGVAPWAPPPAPDSVRAVTSVDSALARAALLDRLGMDSEEGLEYDRLARDALASGDVLLATGRAFVERGLASRAITLANAALDGAVRDTTHPAPRDARLYRLLYPATHVDVLAADAARQGLDPALVAAIIRQESNWNPRATSAVGARGLMQVMPEVGRTLAPSLGITAWDPALLYQPEVNLAMGVRHLDAFAGVAAASTDEASNAAALGRVARALAAYNAGDSRVRRWSARAGVRDPEVFIERIPFAETRGYVRIVLRNRDLYRALYPW